MLTTVTTVLGDSRPVTRTYGDGSVDCPWCSSPILVGLTECQNPACWAYPSWKPEALREHMAKVELQKAREARDEANRRAVHAAYVSRQAEHEVWEAEQIAEAKRRGACLRCLFQAGWERVKFVKHRKPCPKR